MLFHFRFRSYYIQKVTAIFVVIINIVSIVNENNLVCAYVLLLNTQIKIYLLLISR